MIFKGAAIFLITVLLMMSLGGAYYASYSGVGIVDAGTGSARQGSIFGINVLGGGPGSGK